MTLILITGISGRIGRNLVTELIKKGHNIRGLFLPGDDKIQEFKKSGVECFEGNLELENIFPSLLNGVEAVYHFGALLLDNGNDSQIFNTNIRGTFNLLNAIANNKISLKRFVFASSDEVYPSLRPKYLPIDEKHTRQPYSLYGMSKVIGEDLCSFYLREHKIPTVCARISATIEAEEIIKWFSVKVRLQILEKITNPSEEIMNQIRILKETFKKNGDSIFVFVDENDKCSEMPICDARDLAKGLFSLLDNNEIIGESFNFGPLDSFSFDDAARYLSKKINLPYIKIKYKGFLPVGFKIDISKAQKYLKYLPVWDIFKIIDYAVANR